MVKLSKNEISLAMKKLTLSVVLTIAIVLVCSPGYTQGGLIKKPKFKLDKNILNGVFGEEEDEKQETSTPSNEPSVKNQPRNTSGGKMAPPDVLENIEDAESSYQGKNFSDTRFAVQQALHGVELEIGHEILNSLPENISGIPYVPDQDEVVSSGVGFAGLVINRNYTTDDQSVDLTIANNSAFASAANMYIANPAYASSDGNQKVVKTKEGRAYLEYDDYTGYKLSLPIGQSSILMMECVSFPDDDAVVAAVNSVDIARIKELLGEN